ncbi:MAG: type II secretion system protein [Candidatus Omnitrophica bacterium]|nr:type II secretion system protein [Candidatus Omnitrophota bacterium]
MVVLLIIGILAAIAVPNFQNARAKTRTNACINNLRLIDAAKEQYAIDNGKDSAVTPAAGDLTAYLKGNQMPRCSVARLCGAIPIAPPRSLPRASHLGLFDQTVRFIGFSADFCCQGKTRFGYLYLTSGG